MALSESPLGGVASEDPLARAKRGDRAALHTVLLEQKAWINRRAVKVAGEADGPDLAQRAYAEVLAKGLTGFNGTTPRELRAYLKTIIRRQHSRASRGWTAKKFRSAESDGREDKNDEAEDPDDCTQVYQYTPRSRREKLWPPGDQGSTRAWFTVRVRHNRRWNPYDPNRGHGAQFAIAASREEHRKVPLAYGETRPPPRSIPAAPRVWRRTR